MKSAHSLEYLAPHHHPIIASAVLAGVDVEPVVGGAQRLIGYGNTKYGYGAACILDVVQTPYVIEPHVIWLPWVSPADKIINFKWAMAKFAETHEVLLHIEKKQNGFFEHFVKRGLLRKVGHIEVPIIEEIHMYQVLKRK